MKRSNLNPRLAAIALACVAVLPLTAADDPNAGGWQMSVLSGPNQIAVPAPAPATDASFKAELASIKSAQGSLTDAQKKAIEYWKAGGAVRWNQILLELVASTDLPPEPNPDGVASLHAAFEEAHKLGVELIPIWMISYNAAEAIARAADTLDVDGVMVGVSRRNALYRLLRGQVVKGLARRLPKNCHLILCN